MLYELLIGIIIWDEEMTLEILGLNAFGFLSKIAAIVSFLTDSFSMLLLQELQLQFLQYSPLAKHSQYNFKQREFLQLQFFLPVT